MDPLSVTASILTVISAAGYVLKGLDQVRSRLNPDAELLVLINSVNDVQATLVIARDCVDILKKSKSPTAQQSYQDLQTSVDRLHGHLNRLIDFVWVTLLRNGKGLRFLALSDGKKKKLAELRELLSDAHRNLQTVLASANLRMLPTLLSAVEEAVIVQNHHHVQSSAKLEHIVTQITSLQVTKERTSQDGQPILDQDNTSIVLHDTATTYCATETSETPPTSQQLRITTSMPYKSCDSTCICQCHIRKRYQSPGWLSAVVGTLFYSSTNTPALDIRPCNTKSCLRSQVSSSMRFTYYFPTWMMRTALVYSTWSNLGGANSSWMIRMPREIPFTSSVWHHITNKNEVVIKQLLQSRKMSPWDVDQNGRSVLYWAERNASVDICALLLAAGADWHLKDRNGGCPADGAWISVLRCGVSNPEARKLRSLLGSEDSFDLKLSPVHRIILGMSSADLEQQLELNPSLVNECNWVNMSPLMCAAHVGDHDAVSILLSHKANVDIIDQRSRSALHFAASEGSYECIKLLLEAGADPGLKDNRGVAPLSLLMNTYTTEQMDKMVSLFKEYGADIDARDISGRTPIHVAVEWHNASGIEALAKYGADIDILNYDGKAPIVRAVEFNSYQVLYTLARLGARLSWNTTHHYLNDIFKVAVLRGTLISIRILTMSKAPPVAYDLGEIQDWYYGLRNQEDIYLLRQEDAPPEEEEIEALIYLLNKKGIRIDDVEDEAGWCGRDEGLEGVELESGSEDDDTECDEENDQREGEKEEDEIEDNDDAEQFEDAFESFPVSMQRLPETMPPIIVDS